MRFTSEDAYEAHEEGDPIMISHARAVAIVRSHCDDVAEFEAEQGTGTHDAWDVLSWLGY